MEPETIAAVGAAVIAAACAVGTTGLWLKTALAKHKLARDLLKEREAHGNLKTAHIRLGSIYAEAEQFLAAERASHATTRAELEALKARNSERTRKGNLTRTAKRLALRSATTEALQACVGGR